MLLQFILENPGELPGDFGIFDRVFSDLVDFDFEHLFLLFSRADQLRDGNHGVLQIAFGQLVQAVSPFAGIEQVGSDHRVDTDALQKDAGPHQHDHIVLDVLIRNLNLGVFQ